MIGSNPRLADQAPIELPHHEKMTAAVRAAEAFILEGAPRCPTSQSSRPPRAGFGASPAGSTTRSTTHRRHTRSTGQTAATASFEEGRWDDPDGEFRTLYAAATPSAAYTETLAVLRPAHDQVARIRRTQPTPPNDPDLHTGKIPVGYLDARHIGVAACHPDVRLIDMSDPATHASFPAHVRRVLGWFDIRDADRGTVMTGDRRVTRYLARHLWQTCRDRGLTHIRGLRYESRLTPTATCFALWDDPSPIDTSTITLHPVEPTDPSLLRAVEVLGLSIAPD